MRLKKVLSIVLKMCNFINHGTKQPCAIGSARGFAMESLHSLSSFKLGSVSALHFLSISLAASEPHFLESFKMEVAHIHAASRENTLTLKAAVNAFVDDLTFARRELTQVKECEVWSGHSPPRPADLKAKASSVMRMTALYEMLECESEELRDALDKGLGLSIDVQRYFCVSDKRGQATSAPCEELFRQFASFIDDLEAAWMEIERQPAAWRKFMSNEKGSGDETPTQRRHSLSSIDSGKERSPTSPRASPRSFKRRLSLPSQALPDALDTVTTLADNVPVG